MNMNNVMEWPGAASLGGVVGAVAASAETWPPFLRGQRERPARVLLADDDPHMCRVIAQELLADARIHLVAQAHSLRTMALRSCSRACACLGFSSRSGGSGTARCWRSAAGSVRAGS